MLFMVWGANVKLRIYVLVKMCVSTSVSKYDGVGPPVSVWTRTILSELAAWQLLSFGHSVYRQLCLLRVRDLAISVNFSSFVIIGFPWKREEKITFSEKAFAFHGKGVVSIARMFAVSVFPFLKTKLFLLWTMVKINNVMLSSQRSHTDWTQLVLHAYGTGGHGDMTCFVSPGVS